MSSQSFADFGSHAETARPNPIPAAIRTLCAMIGRHMAARQARRELYDLPDVMLSDLGISRSEVASVVRHGRSDATRLARGKP